MRNSLHIEYNRTAYHETCGTEYQQPYRRCNSQTPYRITKCRLRYARESVVCGGGVEFGKRGPKGPGERERTRA